MSFLPPKVLVGADHGGYELKQAIIPLLQEQGFQVEDISPTFTAGDDYPVVAHAVAEKVGKNPDTTWGVLICRSGNGVSMAANRHPGVRAAVVRTSEDARFARLDTQANILALGGRVTSTSELPSLLEAWTNTEPSLEDRHVRRTTQIDQHQTS